MPNEYVPVSCAEAEVAPGWPGWRVEYRTPTGYPHVHVFPTAVLAARCAEYGLDPTDPDRVVDLLLHEPWMPEHDTDAVCGLDPGAARSLHKARLGVARKQVTVDVRHPVLAPLRAGHGITPEAVAEHRAALDAHAKTLADRSPAPARSVLGLPLAVVS